MSINLVWDIESGGNMASSAFHLKVVSMKNIDYKRFANEHVTQTLEARTLNCENFAAVNGCRGLQHTARVCWKVRGSEPH